MAEPTFTPTQLASHPVSLTDAESALLATVHDGAAPRANQMTRGPGGVFIDPLAITIHVLADGEVHRHTKTGGGKVCPSPDGTRFLVWSSKQDVLVYDVGTDEAIDKVFAYPGGPGLSSRGGHVWGVDWLGDGHAAVLYSGNDNATWVILCERTDHGWVEVDNAKLRSGTSIAALGAFVLIGNSKRNKVEVYGMRDGRLHKCASLKRDGGPMRLLGDDGQWTLCLASPYGADVEVVGELDALWESTKAIKPKRDTHLLHNLCTGPAAEAFDEETIAARRAAYETFAAEDGKVERFVGATSRGFVAQWPKDVVRHVVCDGDAFDAGPKLVAPGKRFGSAVRLTRRVGDLDVMTMSGGCFVIP